MTDPGTLGPWLRRFLEEHLVSERNLARNTQLSYRDTLVLLLPFIAAQARRSLERLRVRDLGAARIRAFLLHLEQDRGCSPQTRNQRLAAIRALARFVASHCPEQVELRCCADLAWLARPACSACSLRDALAPSGCRRLNPCWSGTCAAAASPAPHLGCCA